MMFYLRDQPSVSELCYLFTFFPVPSYYSFINTVLKYSVSNAYKHFFGLNFPEICLFTYSELSITHAFLSTPYGL